MSDADARQSFQRMRRFATGILILMAILLLALRWAETYFELPFLSYFHAFAEAAVVGGLADWFAVTALFRHPLGVPIPHTAIIPQNQASIARGLARFVENNFLAPEVLQDKIRSLDLITRSEKWLAEPENSELVADKITGFLPEILEGMDDDDIQEFISQNINAAVERADIATVAGQILEAMKDSDRDNEIFHELMQALQNVLEENKPALRKALRKESPWMFRGIMENQVFDRIVTRINKTFNEVAEDRNHPLRKRIYQEVSTLADRLQDDPELRQRVESYKTEMLHDSKVQSYVKNLWGDLKHAIVEDCRSDNSRTREEIRAAVNNFSQNLIADRVVRLKMNTYINDGIVRLLARNRENIASLIENTINNWDKATMVDKLEIQVGKDLQYIRINGTLVGGTVGLLLHAVAQMF